MYRASVTLALCNATVVADPSSAPLADRTVVVAGETIEAVTSAGGGAIPEGAETLDCTGCTIVAGFWNSHVHFFERKWSNAATLPADELRRQLEDFTRYGFTTVFDLSSLWENTLALRKRIDCGVAGPRILSTGEALIPSGGLPPKSVMRVLGIMDTPMPEIAGEDAARDYVRATVARGVDAIKLFASSQTGAVFAADAMTGAVAQAHAAAKPVFAHVNSTIDVEAAVRSGVDVIAHTTPSTGKWDDALIGAMRDAGVALTPTLSLWERLLRHDRISAGQSAVDTAVEQLRRWDAEGGSVLFGTDYGAVPADPLREYALMREAGMAFDRILDALTMAPCARFGESDVRGRVAAGMAADLVVLEGDPCANLSALAQVRYTVRRGEIVYRG